MNPVKQGILAHVDGVSMRIISVIGRQVLREEWT